MASADNRQSTILFPPTVEIALPGELSVRPLNWWKSVPLAKTPGVIEINPTTLTRAREQWLSSRAERYEKLKSLNAPHTILQNEIKLIKTCEEGWKNSGPRPEDHAFQYKLDADFPETADALTFLSKLLPWEHIDLKECPVNMDCFSQFCMFSNVRSLCLNYCVGITDEMLVHLAALSHLRELQLVGCSISDTGLSILGQMSGLLYLNLSECAEISDKGLTHLQFLTELEDVDLCWCRKLTSVGIEALKAAMPKCDIEWVKG